MSKNKFVGREITVDGKVGVIHYANRADVIVKFPDKSRISMPKNHAAFLLLAKVL